MIVYSKICPSKQKYDKTSLYLTGTNKEQTTAAKPAVESGRIRAIQRLLPASGDKRIESFRVRVTSLLNGFSTPHCYSPRSAGTVADPELGSLRWVSTVRGDIYYRVENWILSGHLIHKITIVFFQAIFFFYR